MTFPQKEAKVTMSHPLHIALAQHHIADLYRIAAAGRLTAGQAARKHPDPGPNGSAVAPRRPRVRFLDTRAPTV